MAFYQISGYATNGAGEQYVGCPYNNRDKLVWWVHWDFSLVCVLSWTWSLKSSCPCVCFVFCKKQIYYYDPFVELSCLFSNGRAKPLVSAIRLLRFVTAKCPLNRVEQMTDDTHEGLKNIYEKRSVSLVSGRGHLYYEKRTRTLTVDK